jgi:hAT family C-terminal dimerisation region
LCITSYKLRSVFKAICNSDPNGGLDNLRLDDYQWDKINSIATFLNKAHEITQMQSSQSQVTLSLVPGTYLILKKHCEDVIAGNMPCWISLDCKEAALAMMEKLESYDTLINNNIVKMAKLFDPRMKSDTTLMNELRSTLVEHYNYGHESAVLGSSSSTILNAVLAADGADFDDSENFVWADEVTNFFQFTSIADVRADPLLWWKAAETRFPTIAKMARDYLAVQATSVASESTFSTSGQLITSNRVCLSDESIEASMLCRNWMRFNFNFCK